MTVTHLRHIDQFELIMTQRTSDALLIHFLGQCSKLHSKSFSLTIPVNNRNLKTNLKKIDRFLLNRSTSHSHDPNITSQNFFRFTKNQLIIKPMMKLPIGLKVIKLGLNCLLNQPLLCKALVFKLLFDSIAHSVEDPWDSQNDAWFKDLKVFLEFQHVSMKETDFSFVKQNRLNDNNFHHMGQRKVRNVNVFVVKDLSFLEITQNLSQLT